jgi:hypothetical protein
MDNTTVCSELRSPLARVEDDSVVELILALEAARNEFAAVEQVFNSKLQDIAEEVHGRVAQGGSAVAD